MNHGKDEIKSLRYQLKHLEETVESLDEENELKQTSLAKLLEENQRTKVQNKVEVDNLNTKISMQMKALKDLSNVCLERNDDCSEERLKQEHQYLRECIAEADKEIAELESGAKNKLESIESQLKTTKSCQRTDTLGQQNRTKIDGIQIEMKLKFEKQIAPLKNELSLVDHRITKVNRELEVMETKRDSALECKNKILKTLQGDKLRKCPQPNEFQSYLDHIKVGIVRLTSQLESQMDGLFGAQKLLENASKKQEKLRQDQNLCQELIRSNEHLKLKFEEVAVLKERVEALTASTAKSLPRTIMEMQKQLASFDLVSVFEQDLYEIKDRRKIVDSVAKIKMKIGKLSGDKTCSNLSKLVEAIDQFQSKVQQYEVQSPTSMQEELNELGEKIRNAQKKLQLRKGINNF